LIATTDGRETGSLEDENEEAATKRAVDFDSEHAVTAAMAKSEHHLGGGSEGVAEAAVAVAAAPRNEALEAVAAAATTTTRLRKQKLSQMCDAGGGWLFLGWSGDRLPFMDRKWVELSTEPT
jgi:hypothetical protein